MFLRYAWLCPVLILSFAPLHAQEGPPALPEEVQAFLERDQLQRWAVMIQTGDSIFNNESCVRCHGENGTAGRFAPDLTDDEWVQSDGSLEESGK